MFKSSQVLSGIAFALTAFAVQGVQAQVLVTVEAPGVQASQVAGVTTETFDGFGTGVYTSLTSSIGTYTSPGEAVVAANLYSGAGGTGNYFSIGAQSNQTTATLTLDGNHDYFGLWYCAGDAQNKISLYENSTLLTTFTTASLVNLINLQTTPSAYYGNPTGSYKGQDGAEPFAYVNFSGTNGTVFNKIVFSNNGTGTGFESDNHSIRAAVLETNAQVTPEPSAWAMVVTGCMSGAAYLRRKRAR